MARRKVNLERRIEQLEDALRRARGVGDALRRVGLAVREQTDLDALLLLIVENTAQVLDAERCTLYLREGDKLDSRMKLGDEIEQIDLEIGQGVAGQVAKTGRPIRIKNAYADDRFDSDWDIVTGFHTTSLLAVPFKNHRGRNMGVIQVLNKRGAQAESGFTCYDVDLLKALASQTFMVLDRTLLVERLRTKNAQLRETQDRLVRSFRDLELLYELEVAMSRAETLSQLACSVITLVAGACDAAAGALLHKDDNGAFKLYLVSLSRPTEVRQVVVQEGEGIVGRAMLQGDLILRGESRSGDPRRVRELLGINVRSAIASRCGDKIDPAGALALYNHAGRPSRFTEDDCSLLKVASANVATEMRVFASRARRVQNERLGEIGRLMSGLMHDLRTPMAVIYAHAQLMERNKDRAERKVHREVISDQFHVVKAMQADLLAYARGETPLLVRQVFVDHLCRSVANQFSVELAAAEIELVLDMKAKVAVYVDERGLGRALDNLVRNGIEAMPSGGTLTVRTSSSGDDLRLEVIDTGGGVPKAIRERLFEPFVTSGKKLGTGLGLANVRRIVEEHGGEVEVSSSRQGTTFSIWIPNALKPHGLQRKVRSPKHPQNSYRRAVERK